MTTEQPREPGILVQPAPVPRASLVGGGSGPGAASPIAVVGDAQDLPGDAPPFASWWRRVAASLLDTWLVATVSFLFGGTFDTSWGFRFESPPRAHHPGAAWWVAVAVLLVLQAYTGSTPGKRALGIAVVREVDGRPLGLLRTCARELVHIVDALLCFVGYLRPLWHRRRRTFADSVMASDVLVTRSPRPHRGIEWLHRRRVPLPSGQVATAVAGALCTVAVLALIPGHEVSGGLDETCQPDPGARVSATEASVLAEIGPTPDGGWTRPTSAVDEKWLTSPTPRLLEARAMTPGWDRERRLGIARGRPTSDTAMFWWVYGGPVTTLTAVLGPTQPDGSRSVVDDAHAVRLEVDVANGAATINHGTVSVASIRPGIVGVSFVASARPDASESFGWTATAGPAAGAPTSCGDPH